MSDSRRTEDEMFREFPDDAPEDPPREVRTALEADRAALAREAAAPGLPPDLFDAIAAETVERTPGPVERLREAPTWLRLVGVVLALGGLLGLAAGLMGLRPDETWADATRVVVLLVALGGLAAAALSVALRGYHARPLGPLAWGVIVLALGVPVVLALWPDLWATGASSIASVGGHGHGHGHGHGGLPTCLIVGTLMTVAAMGVVWLFERPGHATGRRMAAAAAAGGLMAFTALQLHCPSHDITHLLFEHASVGFVVAGAALVAVGWRERHPRR